MRRTMTAAYPRLLGPAVAALMLTLVAACSTGAGANWHLPDPSAAASKDGFPLKILPAVGSVDVSTADPVTVTIEAGKLDTVNMVNSVGKSVAGTFDADRTAWRTTEQLGYAKSYTVAAVGTAAQGRRVELSGSFSTVKPSNLTMPYLRSAPGHLLEDSPTYGVGQPISLYFDEAIADRTAVEKNLMVVTDPPVVGRWHWFDPQELHWRPEAYWAPGTKVTVRANVYGRDLGGGLYGESDASASFTIGPSKIAVADYDTHRMLVYINGTIVREIPISMGKGGSTTGSGGQVVDFWTRGGPHVVMGKEPETRMQSASFGIRDPTNPEFYDVKIKWTVHLSGAGEYAHLRDWDTGALGHTNTSHGCLNIGPGQIRWFYDTFNLGDVVDVTGSPIPLPARDGLGDWNVPWSQW